MSKRLGTILSFLIVAFTSIGWVIKDTANPVQIYTGSNTSPSMSVATDGSISFTGAIKQSICTKSASYTITDVDGCDSIFVTTSGTDRTITLPSATTNTGRKIVITKVDTGTGMVLVSGSVKSPFASAQYDRITIQSDGSVWYPDVVITKFVTYTPTLVGFGTISASEFSWKRVGDVLHVKGKYVAGTTTATEARIPFPISVTSSTLLALEAAGYFYRNATLNTKGEVYRENGIGYFTMGRVDGAVAGFTKQNAITLASSTDVISFEASCPISGW